MKILLDHCIPKPLRRHLIGHDVRTAYEMGWERLKNGNLLNVAQAEFGGLLTVDQNIPHQQNLQGRSISLIVLAAPSNTMETLTPFVPQLLTLLLTVQPGRLYQLAPPEPGTETAKD